MRVVMLVMNDMTADARVEREATALADQGHEVVVLALRGEGLPETQAHHGGFSIARVADYGRAGWSTPRSKLAELRSRTRILVQSAVSTKPDVVHAHDTDMLSAGVRAASITGASLVYDAHELYPDMITSNRAGVPLPLLAYWQLLERRYIPRADAVLTVGDALAETLGRRFGVTASVVRNAPELIRWDALDRSRLRAALNISDARFIVLYQGLINRGRGLEPLLHAMARIEVVDFVMQGNGPMVGEIRSMASGLGLSERVHYTGSVPPDELTEWASGADLGSVLIENLSLNNYLSAPNKLYQYLMAGIPVIGSDFPEIASVIHECDCGFVCNPSDVGEVSDALERAVALGVDGRSAMGRRARALAETRYNWDAEKAKLLDVYERLEAARRR